VTADASGYIPGSLHKGELGIAVPAADLTRPEIASMPFFGTMLGDIPVRSVFPRLPRAAILRARTGLSGEEDENGRHSRDVR